MSLRTRYIATETLISIAINVALSIGFVFVVFHGVPTVEVGGRHGMIIDMAPQTFMVTLMSCLVPGLLTRNRHAAGRLAWHESGARIVVSKIILRAVVVAVFGTCVVLTLSALTFPHLFAGGLRFGTFLIGKAIFGGILAAIVTPWAIARVLRQKTFQAG
jgi:hypothetical protein